MRRERQRAEVIHILHRVKPLGVHEIMSVICYMEDITREQLLGDRKSKKLVAARAAVSVLGKFWGHSFSHIGRCLRRDHATVMHHWRQYGENFEVQNLVKRAARLLRFELGGRK